MSRLAGTTNSWLVAWLLAAAYTLAFIDRQILNLLIDPIRVSLQISDTQASLLQGMAFSSAYILFTPLFGRLADRANRIRLLRLGTLTWCLCTIGCGLAGSYSWLFAFRFGVGAAEACVGPLAWSLLADHFTRERLPRAMSVYMLGPYLGAGLALIFGGALLSQAGAFGAAWSLSESIAPWQITLALAGVAGLPVVASLFLVREPPRDGSLAATKSDDAPAMREVLAFLAKHGAFFGRFYAAMALIVIVLYALPAWMPAVLTRRFGVELASIGLEYGVVVLLAGTGGVLSGPIVNSWIRARSGEGAQVILAASSALALIPTTALLPFSPSYGTTLALAGVITFLFSLPQATSASALQLAAPARMRGVAAAIYVFIVSVVGLGIAPLLVALITDRIFDDPARLASSLAIVCAVSATLAAWLALRAIPHYGRMIANLDHPTVSDKRGE